MRWGKTQKRTNEKILNVFAWLIFVISFLTAILSVFASFSGEKDGKEIFGHKFLIVASDSMSKSVISQDEKIHFDAGDLVIIKIATNETVYKEGDVISFFSRNPDSYGKTLTHKIRKVNYSPSGQIVSYTTYGINTGVDDRTVVSPDVIIGVYSGKIANVGTLLAYLKTPLGYYLSILIPSVLLIMFFSIKVGKILGKRESANERVYDQDILEIKERLNLLESKNQALSLAGETAVSEEAKPNDIEAQLVDNEQDEKNDVESELFISNSANEKRPFAKRILTLKTEYQNYFNAIHNELISYKKVRDRISFRHATYRMGRKLLAKITVRGKTLKLHLALDVAKFNKNVFFQKDMSSVKAYAEVPFTVKVKSARAEKNACRLIQALMQEIGAEKNEKHENVNIINQLSNSEQEQANKVNIISNVAKKTFSEKLAGLDSSIQGYYATISKELVSYKKVNERLSNKHVTYRMGRKLLAKITVRGKTLKLHLALDVAKFNKNVFFPKDMSSVKAYVEVPFTVKVKSARAEKNAVKLISELMLKNNAVKKKEK